MKLQRRLQAGGIAIVATKVLIILIEMEFDYNSKLIVKERKVEVSLVS